MPLKFEFFLSINHVIHTSITINVSNKKKNERILSQLRKKNTFFIIIYY
jgi:hypothetical protein